MKRWRGGTAGREATQTQQQASRRGRGRGGSEDSLSLVITFTSEIQVNHTRNQERHFEHGERHSSSYKENYITTFYGLLS